MICRESSSIAFTPFDGSMPACAALPIALTVKRPTPLRTVFKVPPGSEGSRTRTALHWRASDSISVRDELLPTSSSLVRSTVTFRVSLPRSRRPCIYPHQENSSLHVEYAGPHRFSRVDPKRPLFNFSRMPDCVGVTEEENPFV